MVMWIIILSLIIIGLVLIIVEVIFIPGTTVVGVLGLIFAGIGVLVSYRHFGDDIGFYVLLGTLSTTAVALFFSFRSGAWRRYSLKSSINSRVNEGLTDTVNVGDEGVTVSTLRPVGKAEINGQIFEVRTNGDYVKAQQPIRVVYIELHQIFVQEIK
jgi:membrane-bound ClpP family serine protease